MNALLTTDKIAPLFGVAPKTIQLWALQGLIEGSKIGKRWFFKQEAVEQALEANRR